MWLLCVSIILIKIKKYYINLLMMPYIMKELGVYPGWTRQVIKIILFYGFYDLSNFCVFSLFFYWFNADLMDLLLFNDLKLVIVIRSILFPLYLIVLFKIINKYLQVSVQ